ncbi:MAG: YopX family protein [Oscillospiraceae bacterium]
MRERLSRGKRTDNDEGEFVYGIPVEGEVVLGMGKQTYIITIPGIQWVDGVYMTYDECIEVDPETVGDYIGRTDKNGKKIFEGDIVKGKVHEMNGYRVRKGVIEYHDVGFIMNLKPNSYYDQKNIPFDCEVVGNIWDNPDLLEAKQNG